MDEPTIKPKDPGDLICPGCKHPARKHEDGSSPYRGCTYFGVSLGSVCDCLLSFKQVVALAKEAEARYVLLGYVDKNEVDGNHRGMHFVIVSRDECPVRGHWVPVFIESDALRRDRRMHEIANQIKTDLDQTASVLGVSSPSLAEVNQMLLAQQNSDTITCCGVEFTFPAGRPSTYTCGNCDAVYYWDGSGATRG
jgi:hypothetical protein